MSYDINNILCHIKWMIYDICHKHIMSIWVSKEASGPQQSNLKLQISLQPHFRFQNEIIKKLTFSLYKF
jgi:hypothetical protein